MCDEELEECCYCEKKFPSDIVLGHESNCPSKKGDEFE